MRIEDIARKPVFESVKPINKQDAIDRKMFGPVYHGTNAFNREKIGQEGFKIGDVDVGRTNGYQGADYAGGIPAPIHHLGYGVYFTTVKAIAKKYNGRSVSGLVEYYIDAPRLETINFGSPNTMMRWWVANGYDYKPPMGTAPHQGHLVGGQRERIRATENLTNTLKSKFDAVWFKGQAGPRKLLDGDQVCVYDPARIYKVDHSLSKDDEVGAKIVHNQSLPYDEQYMAQYGMTIEKNNDWTLIMRSWPDSDRKTVLHSIPPPGMVGVIIGRRTMGDHPNVRQGMPARAGNAMYRLDVKWAKGGTMYNYLPTELDPAPRRK